jgi:hypothetical protein
VVVVGQRAELELDGLAFGLEGDADQLVGGNVFRLLRSFLLSVLLSGRA